MNEKCHWWNMQRIVHLYLIQATHLVKLKMKVQKINFKILNLLSRTERFRRSVRLVIS